MQPNPIELVSASLFSMDELVGIYNRTRVDYLIPMPMNAARLAEYVHVYDVALEHSFVAKKDGEVLGLAMLAVRQGRAWITRLGVIPSGRQHGAGYALMTGLIERARAIGIEFIILEVVKNNLPAHRLFTKLGFREVGELLILRHAPTERAHTLIIADAERLENFDALRLLAQDRGRQAWTSQSESLINVNTVSGLRVTLADGSRGWLVYQRQKFTLTRFAYKVEIGDPAFVTYALLSHLHHQYPRLDTQIENIYTNDPALPAFFKMGYLESFRRIEMWLGSPT